MEKEPPMSCDNDWPASNRSGGSRRIAALIEDTREWIDKLESDAHWARTPDIRRTAQDKARILKDLLELAERAR